MCFKNVEMKSVFFLTGRGREQTRIRPGGIYNLEEYIFFPVSKNKEVVVRILGICAGVR